MALPPEEREQSEEAEERDAARIALHEALLAGGGGGEHSWLLAHLLYYHQREAKSQWWEWFHHLSLDEDELIDDTDTIGGLQLVGEPVEDGRSLVYTFTFPPQEHKIDGRSVDPRTQKTSTCPRDDERGIVSFRRCEGARGRAAARGAHSPKPIPDWNTATPSSDSRSRSSTASAEAR